MTRILFGPLLVLVFVSSAVVLSSSQLARKNTLNLPAAPDRHANVELPAYFAEPGHNHDNTPSDNPLTDDGATLGRVLFYDTACRPITRRRARRAMNRRTHFPIRSTSARDFTALRRIVARCRWSTSVITSVRDSSGTKGRAISKRWCCSLSKAASRWDRTFSGPLRFWRTTRCIPRSSGVPSETVRLPKASREGTRAIRPIHRVLPVTIRRGARPRTIGAGRLR